MGLLRVLTGPETQLLTSIADQDALDLREQPAQTGVVRQVAIRAARFPTVALICRLVWP
jgi:hypothetical protein